MTTTVPPSLDDARSFLVDHLDGRVEDVEIVGEGAWSRGFGFTLDGDALVARFGAHVEDFTKDRIATGFAAPDLPVPEVIDVGQAFGMYFAISRRVTGEFLEALSPDDFVHAAPSLFHALDAMRCADISHTSGFGAWGADGHGPHGTWRETLLAAGEDVPGQRISGWSVRLAEDPPSARLFNECLRRVDVLAAATPFDVRTLVHADLINRNVLVHDGLLTGVFDWGCSLYGDFVYDLAWLEIWSPWHEGLRGFPLREVARGHFEAQGVDVPDLDARVECCVLHIAAVHLAYNAQRGDQPAQVALVARTAEYLD